MRTGFYNYIVIGNGKIQKYSLVFVIPGYI